MNEQDIYNDPAARARLVELMRKPKTTLCTLWRKLNPNTWTMHPVSKWDKQEIAWGIVRAEVEAAAATELLNTLTVGDEVVILSRPGHVFRVTEVSVPYRAIKVVGPVETPEWVNIASVRRAAERESSGAAA